MADDLKTATSNSLTAHTVNQEELEAEISDTLSAREIYVKEETECVLCGNHLEFHHLTDFVQLSVIETASCKSCRMKFSKRLFTLN